MRNVVLDCAEPRVLAEFYRAALGWSYVDGHEDEDPAGDDWLQLRRPLPGPCWRSSVPTHRSRRGASTPACTSTSPFPTWTSRTNISWPQVPAP